jgi:hypothetical protein
VNGIGGLPGWTNEETGLYPATVNAHTKSEKFADKLRKLV